MKPPNFNGFEQPVTADVFKEWDTFLSIRGLELEVGVTDENGELFGAMDGLLLGVWCCCDETVNIWFLAGLFELIMSTADITKSQKK